MFEILRSLWREREGNKFKKYFPSSLSPFLSPSVCLGRPNVLIIYILNSQNYKAQIMTLLRLTLDTGPRRSLGVLRPIVMGGRS